MGRKKKKKKEKGRIWNGLVGRGCGRCGWTTSPQPVGPALHIVTPSPLTRSCRAASNIPADTVRCPGVGSSFPPHRKILFDGSLHHPYFLMHWNAIPSSVSGYWLNSIWWGDIREMSQYEVEEREMRNEKRVIISSQEKDKIKGKQEDEDFKNCR